MYQFEIYFFGLITHTSKDVDHPERKEQAGLVRDASGDHTPLVLINGDEHTVVPLMSTSLGAGEAAVHSSFDVVPHLAAATRRKDKKKVKLKPSGFVGTFAYPPGTTLMVAMVYGPMAKIVFPSESPIYTGCIGCIEVAVFQSENSNITFNFAGQPVPISSDDVIVIFNGSKVGHNHFMMHKNVTDADEIAEMTKIKPPPNCSNPSLPTQLVHFKAAYDAIDGATTVGDLHIDDLTQVDCSSSQWP